MANANVKPVPEGYHTITPFLMVEGADKLVEFMKKAFDAQERYLLRDDDGKIMHAEMKIGDSIIMAGDTMGKHPSMAVMIYLYTEDADAWYKKALAAGATSVQEPKDQFYGDHAAAVKDAFGNIWWCATHIEDVPDEELRKRAKLERDKTGGNSAG